jgi:hypothetical protein
MCQKIRPKFDLCVSRISFAGENREIYKNATSSQPLHLIPYHHYSLEQDHRVHGKYFQNQDETLAMFSAILRLRKTSGMAVMSVAGRRPRKLAIIKCTTTVPCVEEMSRVCDELLWTEMKKKVCQHCMVERSVDWFQKTKEYGIMAVESV